MLEKYNCDCRRCFCLNSVFSYDNVCAECTYGIHEGARKQLNPILFNLEKLFLQVGYECKPTDKEALQTVQNQIQERINFLNENNLNSYSDPKLLEYYELYSQIQQCIFQYHTDQYLLIAVVVIGIPLLVYFRWRMIKKGETTKKGDQGV